MKNIEELLRNIGVEIPSDKKDNFIKSFNDNYKTIKEVDGLRTKIEALENDKSELTKKYKSDISTRDTDLNTLKEQLKDNEALKNQLDELQQSYEKSTKDYEQNIQKMRYENTIKELVNNINFSSNAAKKSFMSDVLSSDLPLQDGKVLGFDDFVENYKKTDADAFKSEVDVSNTPKFTTGNTTTISDNAPASKKEVPILW